jgi:parallel beta-helix repeat protein
VRRILYPLIFLLTLVTCGPAKGATYYLSPSGNDTSAGTELQPWRTVQRAVGSVAPGDTVILADGEYAGFVHNRPGASGLPITYRAENVGGAIIRGDQTVGQDAIYIADANWTVIDGLTARQARRAGIRVSLSNNVVVRNCKALDNGRWGIFTDYCDDLLIEGNECAGSAGEHGCYVSNSGDRPTVRGNTLRDNAGSGLQINADPEQLNPALGKRGDGITEGALVERNVIYGNGRVGGAGINLASVRTSRIVNNLIYHNLAGGIVCWDTAMGQQWGSKDNVVVHNTIYFRPTEGRWCVQFFNGSTGCTLQNNILVGGRNGAIEVDNSSPIRSDHNVLLRASGANVATNDDTGAMMTVEQWRLVSGNDAHSLHSDPGFYVAGADFHLRPVSLAVDAGIARPDVPVDLEGQPRPTGAGWDIGSYERLGTVVPVPPPPPPPVPVPVPTDTLGRVLLLLKQAIDLLRSLIP